MLNQNVAADISAENTVCGSSGNRRDTNRNEIINHIVIIMLLFGVAALLVRIVYFHFVFNKKWDYHMVVFSVLCLAGTGLTLFRNRFPIHIKICIVLSILFLLGAYSLFNWGLLGFGNAWLCMFSVFVAVFFSTRWGVYASIISFSVMGIAGLMICNGIIRYDPEMVAFVSTSPTNWIGFISMLMVFVWSVLYSHNRINRTLDDTIGHLIQNKSELEQEIIERKRIESSLREREELYRFLFENAGDPIFLIKDGTVVDSNRMANELIQDKAVCMNAHAVEIDEAAIEIFVESCLDSTQEDNSAITEWRCSFKNSGVLYFEPSYAHMEHDGCRYVLAIIRDITARKNVERTLIQEKQFSDAVIKSLPGIFFMSDEKKHLVRWNHNHKTVTGFSRDELKTMYVTDLVDISEKAYIEHKFEEGIIEGTFRLEVNLALKNGGRLPYYFSGRTMEVDGRRYLIGIGYDLLERRESERALIESENRFRKLVESLPVGVMIVKERTVVYINPVQLNLFGVYPGSSDIDDIPVHSDDINSFLDHHNSLLTGKIKMFELEIKLLRFMKETGKTKIETVQCSGHRITYMGGDAVIISMVSVSRLKALEIQIELEEKMVLAGYSAVGTAYEVKTLLMNINGFADSIEPLISDNAVSDTLQKEFADFRKSGLKASEGIQRIIDHSAFEDHALVPADINYSVSEAIEVSMKTIEHIGIDLETQLAVNLPSVHVKGSDIEEAVHALIDNAINSLKASGVKKQIFVSTWYEEPNVFISVADSGSGIPDELKEKVFEPFYTTSEGAAGTGLTICNRRISDKGGRITLVDSDMGGAEFVIILPAHNKA